MKKVVSVFAIAMLFSASAVTAQEVDFGGSSLEESASVEFGGSNLENETEVEFGGSDLEDDTEIEFGGSDLDEDSEEVTNGNGSSNNSSSGGGGRRRSNNNSSSNIPSEPTVLGASTGPNGTTLSCAPYMIGFAGLGKVNDAAEVKKLQSFLNEFMGESLPVTGYFGTLTDAAVKRLQAKYATDILKPWDTAGLSENLQPTGYSYIMTRWFVNTQVCKQFGTVIPMPDLKKEVAA